MPSKKAQGLPINVIIIAVIALILLIVVLGITTGRLKIFGKGVANCESQGGQCGGTQCSELTPKEKYREIEKTSCEDSGKGKYCCIALY